MPVSRPARPDTRRKPGTPTNSGQQVGEAAPRARAERSPTYGGFHGSTPDVPRRYGSLEMEAIEPPVSSSGRMLDDSLEFAFDLDDDGLELDIAPSTQRLRAEAPRSSRGEAPPPSRRTTLNAAARPATGEAPKPRSPSSSGEAMPKPRSPSSSGESLSQASPNGRRAVMAPAPVDPHAALVAFAGFGEPPATIWSTPFYAARVIVRRRALRADLASARRRRSADVGLYEASLRAADDDAVRNGLTFAAALFTFFMVVVAAAVQLVTGVFQVPW